MVSPAGPDNVPILPMTMGEMSLAPPGGTGAGAPPAPGAVGTSVFDPAGFEPAGPGAAADFAGFDDAPEAAAGALPASAVLAAAAFGAPPAAGGVDPAAAD